MVEKRRTKSWQLFNYLRVFDSQSGEQIGQAFDITTEGMMLISQAAIPKGVVFDFRMELPNTEGVPSEITFRAQSRWRTCDVSKRFFETGFILVKPSPEVAEGIQKVIDELYFRGPVDMDNDTLHAQASNG